jgi:Ribbon-helix-helix protein, copG family
MSAPHKTHGGARPGAGRPRARRRKILMGFKFDPELAAALTKLAKARGLNKSALIRQLVAEEIKRTTAP